MATLTPRLGLRKPNPVGENVNVTQDLNANWDILDGAVTQVQTGVVTAAMTINNSAVLANIPGLAVALAANARYAIETWIFYDADPINDLKLGWSIPAGATLLWSGWGVQLAEGDPVGDIDTTVAGGAAAINLTGAGVSASARPAGGITTAGTAGTLQLRAAQVNATALNTVISPPSWLRVTRLS